MKNPRATWVRIDGDPAWHSVHAVVYGRLWIGHCGKQWADEVRVETGSHDKNDRCDTCQGRVIEAMRVGVCLEELQRSVLWEAEMDS